MLFKLFRVLFACKNQEARLLITSVGAPQNFKVFKEWQTFSRMGEFIIKMRLQTILRTEVRHGKK